MKTIKDKQILVAADFAGYPLKEAVVAHLKDKGWTITDFYCIENRLFKINGWKDGTFIYEITPMSGEYQPLH